MLRCIASRRLLVCIAIILWLCVPLFAQSPGKLVGHLSAGAGRRPTGYCDSGRVVANEVLIRFDSQRDEPSVRRFVDERLKRPYSLRKVSQAFNVYLLRAQGIETTALVKMFRSSLLREDVLHVEPNFIFCVEQDPDDPLYSRQWGLLDAPGINASAAWPISKGNKSIVVGVIDSGIDAEHKDLRDNLWSAKPNFVVTIAGQKVFCPPGAYGFDSLKNRCSPQYLGNHTMQDENGHGTHVSGIIGARGGNHEGIVGVNWETSIMSLKALNSLGTGTAADVIECIEFAIQAKRTRGVNVRVLSNSYGQRCGTREDCPSKILENEIKLASDNDILFVASAGSSSNRDNDKFPHYPSSYDLPNIVSVAWTTRDDMIYYQSHYGLKSVDLGAPGSTIWSTFPFPKQCTDGIKYCPRSGTSMSTAFVSGAAALVLSHCPKLQTQALKDLLLDTVDLLPTLKGKTVSGGRLNVYRAITGCSP